MPPIVYLEGVVGLQSKAISAVGSGRTLIRVILGITSWAAYAAEI